MLQFLLPLLFLILASAVLVLYWVRAARRETVRRRLDDQPEEIVEELAEQPFASRHRLIPLILSIVIASAFALLTTCPDNIALGIGFVFLFVGMEADAWIYRWRIARMESQLADTTDILVSSISSGASLQASLTQAAEFSPIPLRYELEEMVVRLRLGDSPNDVFEMLGQRVPTETFKLLATTLIVNWNAGGELSPTLSSIASTIRDRLAISRQIRTLSTQGTLTTVIVLSAIWFMAAMMWQSDPIRFEGFIRSQSGSWLISGGLLLQGIGVALVSRISRPKI